MDRETFSERLARAATRCVEFSRQFVEETLPDRVSFAVQLNSSYDGNRLNADQRLYPDDDVLHPWHTRRRLTPSEFTDLLWRDGAVPEWIDFRPIGVEDGATVLEALCCGRFTKNDARLYHEAEGYPPFHVLGPSLPIGWDNSKRAPFSLYWSAEVDSGAALERLSDHATRVQLLTLTGIDFDDAALASLRSFEHMRTLVLEATSITGTGLAELAHAPLTHLRISINGSEPLHLGGLGALRSLESLWVKGAPASISGIDALRALRKLEWLDLRLPCLEDIDPVSDLRDLQSIHLDGTRIRHLRPLSGLCKLEHLSVASTLVSDPEMVHLAGLPNLRTLDLAATSVTDAGVAKFCGTPTLWRVWLANTAITDAALTSLASLELLDRLDVRNTRVTPEGLAKLFEARPNLQIEADGWNKYPKRLGFREPADE